jgi:hypothetical protein
MTNQEFEEAIQRIQRDGDGREELTDAEVRVLFAANDMMLDGLDKAEFPAFFSTEEQAREWIKERILEFVDTLSRRQLQLLKKMAEEIKAEELNAPRRRLVQ